jgi:predicted dehydrogenase
MFTAPMLASAPGMSLAAVWTRRPAAAEALAHQHGAATAGSFDDLLAACDAVAFTVPADVQAPLAVAAARAGKHLLLEKPVGFTVADAEAVAAAADDAGVATQLMLTYRFTEQVRAFLSSTAGGQVRYLRTAMSEVVRSTDRRSRRRGGRPPGPSCSTSGRTPWTSPKRWQDRSRSSGQPRPVASSRSRPCTTAA